MHDIKWIRKHPDAFDQAMIRRGLAPVADQILAHDEEKRGNITDLQALQEESNRLAKRIGELKSQQKNADAEIAASKEVKAKIQAFKEQEESGEDMTVVLTDNLLYTLPNILAENVPEGESEEENVEVRVWGEPRQFDFNPQEHYTLGENLGLMDFKQTAKISGSRFSTLKGSLARLERALANFMLDIHTTKYDYTEVHPPLLVRSEAMVGTGQLPKFAEDSFETTGGHWLVPTAEVSLTNQVREMILSKDDLPLRFVAHTPCFRSEAGSAGRDTHGLIRQHQFTKVELVSITSEEEGEKELERKTGAAEEILQALGLPYRVMLLCSGDTGFGAKRTYDLEVWLPGQGKYREISSCSWCGDFQARRMNTRYREKEGQDTRFVHTLNGSGLAVGRTLVAVMENYQNTDGSVTIPDVLLPYMGGMKEIR